MEADKKFQINALALQLETLLLTDSKGMSIEHSSGGVTVDAPSQELILRQSKKQLMCTKEKKQRSVSMSTKSIPGKCNL